MIRKNFNATKASFKSYTNKMNRTVGTTSSSKKINKFNETKLTFETRNNNNFFTKFKNYPDYSFNDSQRKSLAYNVFSKNPTFAIYK